MATGSVPLLEAAKCGDDMLKRGVVETLIQESPLLELLPFQTIQGNALKHSVEQSLPAPEYRQVNATYSRTWGTDREYFWGTTILGGEIFVDNYLVKVRGNVVDVKAKQFAKFAKAMARTFDATAIDGTGSANDFAGLNQLVTDGFGQLIASNGDHANGGAIDANLNDLDAAHDLMRGQVAAQVILGNRQVRTLITQKARTTAVGYPYIDVGSDTFGRKVTMWNDIPYRIIGDDKDGNAILGFDETRGTETAATSIYFLGLSDDEGVTGLLGVGGDFDVRDFGETEAAPGHLGRAEVYPGLACFNPYALVRLAGITNA